MLAYVYRRRAVAGNDVDNRSLLSVMPALVENMAHKRRQRSKHNLRDTRYGHTNMAPVAAAEADSPVHVERQLLRSSQ